MKNLFKKLRSRRGESLVESLASILIFTMGSIILYSMITTAADINMNAKEIDQKHQAQMLVAEKGEGTGTTGTVGMHLTINQTDHEVSAGMGTVNVDVYGGKEENGERTLFAYYVAQPDPTEGS